MIARIRWGTNRNFAPLVILIMSLLLSACVMDLSGSRTHVDECETDCETIAECEARIGKRHPACVPTSWECVQCIRDGGAD